MSIPRTRYAGITPYVTKDGTLIRELMRPAVDGNRNQSLAEASVAPGQASRLHRHHRSEELYYIVAGEGHLTIGDEGFVVRVGDTVCIRPGIPHSLRNTCAEVLRILCCSAPAYSHDDTELL